MNTKNYISVKEYAEIKGLTVQAVYYQIKEKQVEYTKVGSVYLIQQ